MPSFKLLREVPISSRLSFKEMSFSKKGVLCLQSTQTQTFSVVTCLARASRLLCNLITVTGLPKPPRSRAAGQRRSDSSRRGRGPRRSGGQPGRRRDVGGAGTRSKAEVSGSFRGGSCSPPSGRFRVALKKGKVRSCPLHSFSIFPRGQNRCDLPVNSVLGRLLADASPLHGPC